jgi:maleylacetoacetate isomerase
MKLYTYYRSQASFRVRIALNLKGIAREDSYLHLEKGDQFADEYRALNPQMMVPTLIDDGVELFQSLAILEYLNERYPQPPLLPAEPEARAWVRGLALINVADSHPLIVPRVRHYLTDVLKLSDAQRLDICLVTQVTPAKTFDCPLAPYPRIMRIYDTCMAIPAFSDAHPTRQPDAE